MAPDFCPAFPWAGVEVDLLVELLVGELVVCELLSAVTKLPALVVAEALLVSTAAELESVPELVGLDAELPVLLLAEVTTCDKVVALFTLVEGVLSATELLLDTMTEPPSAVLTLMLSMVPV